jgi:hypothetical protein
MNIQDLINKLKTNGIPVICFSFKGEPSVSLTILIISVFLLILGILSNYFVFLKGINGDLAFNFFMASAALYFSRKLSVNGKTASSEKQE